MSNLNRIILVGTVSAKPETRFGTETGASMSKLVLAVDRPAKQDGTIDLDHIPVVAWGKQADFIAEKVQQNNIIIVEGRIQVRTIENAGQRTWITEVIANHVRQFGGAAVASVPVAAVAAPAVGANPFEVAAPSFTEDDVPF